MKGTGGATELGGRSSGKSGSGGSSGGGGGNSGLDQKQLTKVVNKNKSRLRICYEKSLKKGDTPEDKDIKVLLRFKMGGSGMVKNINIGGSGANLPGLKSCFNSSVSKWMFPSSSGESKVETSFLFTPK